MALPGRLKIVDDVAMAFSDHVIDAFAQRPLEAFSFALSGGNTARACYERLAGHGGKEIDWWMVDIYWGDERCVPHDHPDSNYLLAREALLDRVGAANATYLMRCADGPDPYQLRLGDLGRIDLVHLGMGADGHTASLFPGSGALDADPGRLVTTSTDPSGQNPYERMTLTFGGISRANTVLVTVAGSEKAEALAAVASGADLPAAHIDAPQVIWLVDHDAAARLER